MLVKYSRAFPIAPYGINEHIGFEEEIDLTATDPVEYVEYLRELSENAFKRKYPNAIVSNEPIIEQVLSKEQIVANNLEAIKNCKTFEELETLKLISKAHKVTFDAFAEKHREIFAEKQREINKTITQPKQLTNGL